MRSPSRAPRRDPASLGRAPDTKDAPLTPSIASVRSTAQREHRHLPVCLAAFTLYRRRVLFLRAIFHAVTRQRGRRADHPGRVFLAHSLPESPSCRGGPEGPRRAFGAASLLKRPPETPR